jgi:hypothetical protein
MANRVFEDEVKGEKAIGDRGPGIVNEGHVLDAIEVNVRLPMRLSFLHYAASLMSQIVIRLSAIAYRLSPSFCS